MHNATVSRASLALVLFCAACASPASPDGSSPTDASGRVDQQQSEGSIAQPDAVTTEASATPTDSGSTPDDASAGLDENASGPEASTVEPDGAPADERAQPSDAAPIDVATPRDAARDAAIDATLDAAPDARPTDARPADVSTPDAGPLDAARDATPVREAGPDAPIDAAPDAAPDASTGSDAGPVLGPGRTYYVSNAGNDSAAGTSPSTAWRTLAKVEAVARATGFAAGDNILFRRGDRWAETLFWSRLWGGRAPTGTAAAPITLSTYGTGVKPIFEYPPLTASSPAARERRLFGFYGVNYIVVDGLNFTDLDFPANDKDMIAQTGIALQFGMIGESPTADHNTVRNCDFSRVGLGVVFAGDFNTVEYSTFRDLKVLVSTPTPDYDDYLANGVTITGNDLLVHHSVFEGNWANSLDFGQDGGAIEAYGTTNRIRLLYNTFIDCAGIMEIGSSDMSSSSDHLIAYNLMINNAGVTWINGSGVFATSVSNVRYYNNTIIDTPANRWTNQFVFGFNGSLTGTVFDLRNNVFYLTNGGTVLRSANAAATRHENNVLYFTGSASAGYTLGSSEVRASAQPFTSNSGTNPATWNVRPGPGSAALRAGQPLTGLGLSETLDGTPVGSPPNAGAY